MSQFTSRANFKVQGQLINAASAMGTNGSLGDLARHRRVAVTGTRVIDGVLQAETLRFLD
jgi:hypothetical protein